MLSQVDGGKTMEVRPEGDESVRRLKVNVRRAANEMGLQDIQYGETEDGAILVWSEERPRRTRGPRRRKDEEQKTERATFSGHPLDPRTVLRLAPRVRPHFQSTPE
jgi:hypothetical protein